MVTDSIRTFKEPTIGYLRNFILDNHVECTDSIAIDVRMFDELALDYRNTYKEPIQIPFVFLNVWIKIADRGMIGRNNAIITKDDPPPQLQKEVVTNGKEYRCGYCGNLIDEFGNALTGERYELAIKRWKKFGEGIFSPAVGKCCERQIINE